MPPFATERVTVDGVCSAQLRAEKRAAQATAEVASAGARAGTDGAALAALDPLTPKGVAALSKVLCNVM